MLRTPETIIEFRIFNDGNKAIVTLVDGEGLKRKRKRQGLYSGVGGSWWYARMVASEILLLSCERERERERERDREKERNRERGRQTERGERQKKTETAGERDRHKETDTKRQIEREERDR